jgi:hypothetical protein
MRMAFAALLVGCFLAPAAAQAQYIRPANQPRVSPYLNLLRGGSTFGNNYYNLVRPDLEFRSSIVQLQTQTQTQQQDIVGLETARVPTTGHAFGFQNQMGYFNNVSTGGMGGGMAAPSLTQARPTGMPPKGGKR